MADSGRTIVIIVGDGTVCWGISYQLFRTQEEHLTVCSIAYHGKPKGNLFTLFNGLVSYRWGCTIWCGQAISETWTAVWRVNKNHSRGTIKHVWEPRTWATHVEVLATASIFQAPVFIILKNHMTINGEW